jgi:hypothetical protein
MRLTARPKPAYAHGAVPEARDATLLTRIEELHRAVPISVAHRDLLRELGSEFVYARPLGGPGENIGWLVLVRFGSVLESRFGFTREIPLLYSPFADLQIRTTDGLEARLAQLPSERRSVSTNEVLVWAPDLRLAAKLESWSRAARVLLPMPSDNDLEHPERLQRFIDLLASKLASRDLYSARGYVTGDQFFGRAVELQQVADSVRQQEVVGVFGLRKTGKTSLLNELKRSYDSERDAGERLQLFVYQDLEHLPSLSEDPVVELVQDLAENIRRRFKQEGLRTQELADLPVGASPSDFRRALDRLLEKIADQATLVLLLDEIEYLCPPNPGPDTSGIGYQRVRQLFGGLRKLVQERDNFAFVLAGLSSSAIESPELYGAPNPLFSFARPLYLGPFSVSEADELLNGIGRKVSLHWPEDAVALAHGVSGGHALLIRELASIVLQNQRHSRSNTVQIRPGIVHQAIPKWRTAVASHVRDVLPHLRRYYTDEADLAIMLMDDPGAFGDFAKSYSDSVGRLVDLGIVSATPDGGWMPTPLLQFSYEFEKRPEADRPVSGGAKPARSVEELISADESELVERKETLRAHGGSVPDEVIVDQVLKACLGFLNRRGGHVIVGVTDDGTVVGIDRDIKMCGSVDKLLQFLTDKVRTKIGNSGIDLISVTTPRCGDSTVMIIEVLPSPEPVFPAKPVDGKDGLFVRNNNTTNVLVGKEALDYVGRRWKR